MNQPLPVLSRRTATALAWVCLHLSACLVAPPEGSEADAGVPDGNVPSERIAFRATLLSDGDVLVVGGQGEGAKTLNDVHRYHPDTGRWTAAGFLERGRHDYHSLRLPSGGVLVLGGVWVDPATRLYSPLSTVEFYDPDSGLWSQVAPIPQARADTQVTLLRNGRVLLTGGALASTSTARVDLYDPLTNQWSERAPMRLPRAGHTAVLLPDGKVLVAGGQVIDQGREAEVYDPDTNTWTFTRPMNNRHHQAKAHFLPDGQVLLTDDERSEIYEPVGQTWRVAPIDRPGDHPFSFPTRTALLDGRILLSGGSTGPNLSVFTDQVKAYDSRTRNWTAMAPMPEPRVGHEGVLLPDGKVMMIGGWAPGRKAAKHPVMIYDPRAGTWK